MTVDEAKEAIMLKLDEVTEGLSNEQYREVLDEVAGECNTRLDASEEYDSNN